jgi:hypothetical protein
MTARLRIVLPPLPIFLFFAFIYLLLEGPILFSQWRWGGLLPPPTSRPGLAFVSIAAAAYGVYRVVAFHPFYRADYREWLERTPWTSEKPLPVGPVALVWEDSVMLGGFVLLTLAQPLLDPVRLVNVCLLAYLGFLTVTLWPTGAGAFGYVVAFGMGLAVRFHPDRWACLAAAMGTYIVGYAGLRFSLAQFPWPLDWQKALAASAGNSAKFFEHWAGPACGWPYDQLRPAPPHPLRLDRRDALLVSLLAGWWLFAVEGLIPVRIEREAFATAILLLAMSVFVGVRFILYRTGYAPPIDLWGRLVTFRWVIPGYDQILIGPVCTALIPLLAVMAFRSWGVPGEVSIPVALSLSMLVALTAKPSLSCWRLTGRHRLKHSPWAQQSEFIQVG